MTLVYEETLKMIGGRIRKLRSDRGLSMKIAYDIRANYGVKINPGYLSRMERGKTEIPLRTLIAIARFFDLEPGCLTDGAERDLIDPLLDNKIKHLASKIGSEKLYGFLQLLDEITDQDERKLKKG